MAKQNRVEIRFDDDEFRCLKSKIGALSMSEHIRRLVREDCKTPSTVEEAADILCPPIGTLFSAGENQGFIKGAKWALRK